MQILVESGLRVFVMCNFPRACEVSFVAFWYEFGR